MRHSVVRWSSPTALLACLLVGVCMPDVSAGDPYMDAGIRLYNEGSYREALDSFHAHFGSHPNCSIALGNIGRCYQALKDYPASLAHFNSALSFADYGDVEGDPTAAMRNDYIGRGDTLYDMKRFKEAASDFREGVILRPQSSSMRYKRGTALFFSNQFSEAVDELNNAIALNYTPILPAHEYKARALAYVGRYADSAQELTKAIEIAPAEMSPYLSFAVVSMRAGMIDRTIAFAEVDCGRALRLDGGSQYIAIVGHFAVWVRDGMDAAKHQLASLHHNCDQEEWPFPLIAYLHGDISARDIFDRASTPERMSDVQAVFAMRASLKSEAADYQSRTGWLATNGTRTLALYDLAVSMDEIVRHSRSGGSRAAAGSPPGNSAAGRGRIPRLQIPAPRPYLNSTGRPVLSDVPAALPDLPELRI